MMRSALAIGLVAVTLIACSLTGTPAPTTATPKPEGLVATWVEARRIGPDGSPSEPDDPLHIAFFPNGTFKAVLEGRRFETYHDFWGDWQADGDRLTLTITGGNSLPQQKEHEGRFEIVDGELTLEGIVLVIEGDFAGPTTVYTYYRPAPEGNNVP